MLYIIINSILFLNLYYSFSNKGKKFLAFLLIILMWIFFWGNTYNPDYFTYLNLYNSNSGHLTTSLESGFIFLIKISNLMGLSYNMFLLFFSLIGLFLIHSTIKLYTSNFNYIYLLYFIFPFFFDVVQIRNFMVMAIVFYSTRYLMNTNFLSKLKFLILILFASSIQIISLVYLPFILVNIKSKKRESFIQLVSIFSIILSILILLNNKQIPFLYDLIKLTGISKLEIYFNTKTNFGFLIYWFIQLISFTIAYITKRYYNQYTRDSNNNYKLIILNYQVQLLSFIYLPLFLLNSNFIRIIRNLLLLNYLSISITKDCIKNRNIKLFYIIITLLFVLILYVLLLFSYNDSIIRAIIDNNIF
jgi:hypothetical protein